MRHWIYFKLELPYLKLLFRKAQIKINEKKLFFKAAMQVLTFYNFSNNYV